MSATLYVSCKKSSLPTRAQWQAAIKKAGFDLVLGDFDWATQSGYLNAKYKGAKSGFECMVEDAKPVAKQLGVKLPEGNDVVVSFVFGSDVAESHAATAASAALAECVGGAYFDEYSDELLDGATAVNIAQDSIEADQ
ncbi:MAG TPA: hypothetical protein PKE29_10345 [Phycisphaerales bacterium]|nr:hypothetical protein [Phycisphaerales bacterium]